MDLKKSEFCRLMEAVGWTQAEVARRLHISTSAVSQIVSGRVKASTTTLNMLKLLVAGENPSAVKRVDRQMEAGLEDWAKRVVESLRALSEPERKQLLPVIENMIRAIRKVGGGTVSATPSAPRYPLRKARY